MRGQLRRNLLAASAWSHLAGILAWTAGGGAAMIMIALGFKAYLTTFQGGAAAFGTVAAATAQAMKPIAGPAYRLDTLGGYMTYHNLGYIGFFLALYAALQGVSAIRGDEVKGKLQLYLATGTSRFALLAARAGGFVIALAAIALGFGLLTGLALVLGGSQAWSGAMEVAAAAALTALAAYTIGLVMAQLFSTTRTASGVAAVLLTAFFVISNLSDELGWAAPLRFLSPFFYFQQSRYATVPGHGFDPVACLALVFYSAALATIAAILFQRRDVQGTTLALGRWRLEVPRPRAPARSLWTWFLREQPFALTFWAVGAFALQFMYAVLYPSVRSIWEGNALVKAILARISNAPLFDSYLSLTLTVAAALPAAYAVVQGGRWLGERTDGKEDLYLAAVPISRIRLEVARWIALLAGLVLLSLGTVLGLYVGALGADQSIAWLGALRTAADSVLLGLAVGGVTAFLVAWLRSGAALGVLGTLLGASYLVSLFQLLYKWPEWTRWFSIFEAFGTPYVSEPSTTGVAILVGLAVLGALAALIAFGALPLGRSWHFTISPEVASQPPER